jgi:predicted SAM-dependent methyltransferase
METNNIKLNIGCGDRFLTDWMNLDFTSDNEYVLQCDVTKGIPLENGTCCMVYSSHVLEHFSKSNGEAFIKECYRVLQPGGILRIVVPDLETLASLYLESLNKVRKNNSDIIIANYDWSVIEMIDQMVRERSGGAMWDFWVQKHIINEEHIKNRMGLVFINVRNQIKNPKTEKHSNEVTKSHKATTIREKLSWRIKKLIPNFRRYNNIEKEVSFYETGELHKWMYDSYSLGRLFEHHGFKDISKMNAFESKFKDWEKCSWLDVENGNIRKPDSLFIEGVK